MKKQLLFVDDDITMIRLFSLVASKNNWTYESATTCEELKDRLEKDEFQLIFMDIELNDSDSLPLVTKIKQTNPQTKIIMVSGHTMAEYYSKVKEAGADDYFSKPIKIDDFIKKVQDFLQ